MSYTITNIDAGTGNVTVSFSVDNKSQVIDCSAVIGDADQLQGFLGDYETAYTAGVSTAPTVPTDVTALVGKTIGS